MLSERLQILMTPEQRRRLEHEARRRGTSVGRVIRDSVDAQLGGVAADERRAALDGIRQLHGRFVPPEALESLVASERDEQLEQIARRIGR